MAARRKVLGAAVAAALLVALGTFIDGSALAFSGPPAALQQISLGRGLQDHAGARWAPRQLLDESSGAQPSRSALVVACGVAVLAAVRALRGSEVGSRVTLFFRKRYGGGATKRDPAAEFGPQYWGPPLDYNIQRSARLGMPKGGEQRVIPKLSGGSYEARKQLMRGLTTELIRHGRIKTTYARAKALGSFVDRMVVLAKRGDDLARREANEWMFDEKLVENLFRLAPQRYPEQLKGFTQVTKTMNRKGDWAEMAYIELL